MLLCIPKGKDKRLLGLLSNSHARMDFGPNGTTSATTCTSTEFAA